MDWSELTSHMTGLAHIATADVAGRPHVSVVSAVVEGETIWVFTRASSAKARNLRQNPQISMLWSPAAEVYLHGSVTIIDRVEHKRRVWTSGLLPYDPAQFFGTPENPDVVLLKIAPVSALVVTMDASGIAQHRWKT
jgi:general stress protein 26